MVRVCLALMGILGLAGCARVGPDYHLPARALVNAPQARGAFLSGRGATQSAPLPDHWWQLYNEPMLDQLVARALATNTDLRVADANLQRSMALLHEGDTHREIQSGVSGETSWQQRSAEQVLQHVQPPQRQLYDVGLTASYDLDLFGGIRRGIEAASADVEATEAARDLVQINVAAETARAYADVCNAGHQLDVLRRLIGVQGGGLRLTKVVVSHGRSPAFEADRRSGVVEASRARLPGLAARQRNAAFRIAVLIGEPPAAFDPAWLQCDHPLSLSDPLPVGSGQDLLKRRPDIRMAERHLAADTARIGVATAALYPDIRLSGAIGSTGAAVDFLSPLTNRFAIGPLISWTINRSAVRARIEGSDAQANADLAGFDGTVLKALREVEIALDDYAADLDRQQELERVLDNADRVVTRTRRLHTGGRIGALPALDVEREALAAEESVADGEADVNADQIMLFLALGGGWEDATPASTTHR